MKPCSFRLSPWLTGAVVLATVAIQTGSLAQVAPAVSVVAKDEPIELSPFVVATDKDTGYVASTTLAGTRLNPALRDVGSALSVITPDFLRDTGTTSVDDLLVYTMNTEVGGISGNFANSSSDTNRASQDSNRANPNSNNRIRGLSSANRSRDYFLTDIPLDAYNTSGVTISRGPNSILFGIGSPGGVIENSLNMAELTRNRYELSVRMGDRGSNRTTVDINQTVLPGRLAVRFDALRSDTQYPRGEAPRLHVAERSLTVTAQPESWSRSQDLRPNSRVPGPPP